VISRLILGLACGWRIIAPRRDRKRLLWVGEDKSKKMERPADAEYIGSQWNPSLQIGGGLNDHAGSGRPGHIESEQSIRENQTRCWW